MARPRKLWDRTSRRKWFVWIDGKQHNLGHDKEEALRTHQRLMAQATNPDGGVECWVNDDGPGIPEQLAGKVFDKFDTAPSQDGGIGLGLAIVKDFVAAHGGTIRLESEPGVGAVFRFTIPPR